MKRRALSALGFLIVTFLVAVALQVPSADGYEMSLYRVFPWYFWAAVVATLCLGCGIVAAGAFTPEVDDRYWQLGLGLVVLVEAFLLCLPYVRGYVVYGRGDVLTHVGFARSIVQTGTLGTLDIYPSLHLFTVTLSFATGLDVLQVSNLLAPVVSLVSVGSCYLLATQLFDRRRTVLFVTPFAILLVGSTAHVNPSPFAQSVLLLPCVLYLFFREQSTQSLSTRVLLVVALISLVLYHPLTAIFLLVPLVAYSAVTAANVFVESLATPTNAASITGAVFVVWYTNFAGIVRRFDSVFQRLVSGGGTAPLDSYTSTVERTSPAMIDVVEVAIVNYGPSVVLSALASLALVLAVIGHWRGTDALSRPVVTVACSFAAFVALSGVFLVNDFPVGFGRPLLAARLFAVLLAGLAFAALWRRSRRPWVRSALRLSMYGALVLLVVLTTIGLYYSPLMLRSNMQVTEMERSGSEWLFEHDTGETPIETIGLNQRRQFDAHYGKRASDPVIRRSETAPPPHFNYTEYPRLGESYDRDAYLVVTKLGRITYPRKFPSYRSQWRYTPADFDRLERDPSVAKVYSNGEFDLYLIHGNATTAEG